MMRSKKKVAMVVAGFALLGLGATATAGPWFRGGDRVERARTFVEWKTDDALDALEATDGQREAISKVVFRLFDDAVGTFEARDVLREELLSLWQQPAPDAAKAKALIDARIEEMRQLAHRAVDAGVEVHGVLDAKQRDAVADFVRSEAARRGHHGPQKR